MVVTTRNKTKRTRYQQVLDAAIRLSQADQRRLREELSLLSDVKLIRPKSTEEAIRKGRRLADEVRGDLAKVSASKLDDVMRQLRGREW